MGHEEDYNSSNGNKAARGLTGASLVGAPPTPITWRLQGVRGGEQPVDPVRGPLSTGGLYGERAGWSLPGFDDRAWNRVTLPDRPTPRPGVSWYRTNADLRPAARPGHLARPDDHRRPVPPVPRRALRERLA